MQFVADLEPNADGGAADHVRDRRAPRPHRDDARRPLGLRRRAAGPDRQRRVRPAPERRLRRGARLDPAPHAAQPAAAAPPVADRAGPGRLRRRASGASPTRASGRPAARRSTTSRRSSCAGSRWTARRKLAEIRADRDLVGDLARHRRRDQGRHPRARRRRARRAAPALRDRRARRIDAARGDLRLPAPRRRAPAGERPRDRRRADRARLRAALPDRRDRRRAVGQGGHVPHLLVLARLGARDHRRAPARARPDGATAEGGVAARPLRRGVRRRHRPAPRQLPAGVLAPRADRGGGADHRHRAPRGVRRDERTTTSSSSAAARAAARSRATSPRRASASCCSSAATGCPREPQNWSAARRVRRQPLRLGRTRGTTSTARPFQPQVHYFVGGATKLYGAALYRLRAEDFGELRHHDGISPGVADRLRRDGAVLHAGRAALPGARRARRGPDRAAGERAVPVPGGQPRAADPAALRRPRGRRASPVPRPLRRHARRGRHAQQRVRALRDLRRLPVPRAREVRRRGARRAPRARAPQRHAADERRGGRGSRPNAAGHDGHRASSSTTTGRRETLHRRHRRRLVRRREQRQAAAGVGQRRAPERPRERLRPWSGATTCSTTARRCSRSRRSRTRRCSRRRSGSTTSTSAADDVEYPLGNIQMVGKSSAEMYRGEKPLQTKLAPEWTLERRRPPRRRLLALDRGSAAPREPRRRCDRDGRIALALQADERGAQEAAAARAQVACSATSACTTTTCIPRHAYLKNDIPVAGVRPPGRHVPLRLATRRPRC